MKLRNLLETNLSLKIVALIFGTSFWIVCGARYNSTVELSVPLCFYGDVHNKKVECLDEITVAISGKRADLRALNTENLALHINLDELVVGDHLVEVTSEKLFLPNHIKLVHCVPSNPMISISKS
jgi:YbbR domain-containing protein